MKEFLEIICLKGQVIKRNYHKRLKKKGGGQRNGCICVLGNVRWYHQQAQACIIAQIHGNSFLFLIGCFLSSNNLRVQDPSVCGCTIPVETLLFSASSAEKRRPRYSLKALILKWHTSLLRIFYWLELSHVNATHCQGSWELIVQLWSQKEENTYFGV